MPTNTSWQNFQGYVANSSKDQKMFSQDDLRGLGKGSSK